MNFFVFLLYVPFVFAQARDTISERSAELKERLAAENPDIQSELRHSYLSAEIHQLSERIVRKLTQASYVISDDALNEYRHLSQDFNESFGVPYQFSHQISGVSPLPTTKAEIAREVFWVWRTDHQLCSTGWSEINNFVTWKNLPLAIRLAVLRDDLTQDEITQIAPLLEQTKNTGVAHMRLLVLQPTQFFRADGMIDYPKLEGFLGLTRWSANRRFCQAALRRNSPRPPPRE